MFTLKEIIDKRKKSFKNYVDNLFIHEEIKSYIRNDHFIDNNQPEYLFYPEVFFQAFTENKEDPNDKIGILNIAGYLYYRSIIEVDSVIDDVNLPPGKQPEKHFLPIVSSICQEESIKLLTSLFQLDPVFWKIWNIRRFEYLQAVIMDKRKPSSISLQEFEMLADYKSAFGKVAIDSAYILSGSGDKELYSALLESHRLFSVGFQLIDDILDFKKDIQNPQINYALISLKNYLGSSGANYDLKDIVTLNKYLYVHGIAEDLIVKAINYFNRAAALIKDSNAGIWKSFIQNNQRKATSMLIHLRTYNKILDARIKLSNTKIAENELESAINLSKRFIAVNQNDDGYWEDFVNNAGVSNIWSTGFILSNISDLHNSFDTEVLEKGCRFLKSNKQGNLWGYNTGWIEDTDSTTTSLIALSLNGYDISSELKEWIKLQKTDGSFSTYHDGSRLSLALNKEFSDLKGWINGHICVSALAYYFLCLTDKTTAHKEKVRSFLINSQGKDNLWESYWWTSPVYSTSFTLRALIREKDEKFREILIKGLDALVRLQETDGSYPDSLSGKSCFFTALALGTFCSDELIFRSYRKSAESAAGWLLGQQNDDGSFGSSYSLQIPLPGITDPKSIKEWSTNQEFSTNVIVQDYMRLFTTSAVLKSLDLFAKLMSPNG